MSGETLFSLEAEMSVLGGMFMAPEMVPLVLSRVREEDLFADRHRRIFRCLVELADRRAAIDIITVMEALRASQDLEAVGGAPYLSELIDAVPTAANVEYHAGIVARYGARRKLLQTAEQIAELARLPGDESPERLQAEAERLLAEQAPKAESGGLVKIRDLLPAELERIERLESGSDPLGISTGIRAVDDRLGVMEAGDLVLVAARPSMGKSGFSVCNIAADAAIRQQRTVAIFSVETPKERVVTRLLGSEARVNMAAAKKRRGFEDHEYPRLAQATALLNGAPLLIDHTPALTIDQMRVRLRRLERDRGQVDLVVVDYLQLMSDPRAKSRYEEVSRIGTGLKRIAQEFSCVVVALSQLSRAVEQRNEKRPMLSDLRESGTLEQDADVIMMLYRPEYYHGPTMSVRRGRGGDEQQISIEGKAEVILGKVRDGATGTANCLFEKEFTHFRDWS